MSQAAIVVQNLRQGYGRKTVLENLSLEIPTGQTFALLGRNGAGKTTLIRTLLGLLEPTGGRVEVLGLTPAAYPVAVRARIGYLAEDQAMYGWMTAEEISSFLKPFYQSWDDALASRLMDRFEVPRRVKIKHLSKGQTIRLGLALALSHRPELVILDDPALGLDPITRKQFNRDIIDHLQAEGRTVFYSSHLLQEVEAVADAVAIIDKGRIVREGKTDELNRTIKRVILSTDDLPSCVPPAKLLDVSFKGNQVAVTFDDAAPWLDRLQHDSVDHKVEDLTLEEVFEAYVTGRPNAWPNSPRASVTSI